MEEDLKYINVSAIADFIKKLKPSNKITSQYSIIDQVVLNESNVIVQEKRLSINKGPNVLLYPVQKMIIEKIKEHDEVLLSSRDFTGRKTGLNIAASNILDLKINSPQVLVLNMNTTNKFNCVDKIFTKSGIKVCSLYDPIIKIQQSQVVYGNITYFGRKHDPGKIWKEFNNLKLIIIDMHDKEKYYNLVELDENGLTQTDYTIKYIISSIKEIEKKENRVIKKIITDTYLTVRLFKNIKKIIPNIVSIVNVQPYSVILPNTIIYNEKKLLKKHLEYGFNNFKKIIFGEDFNDSLDGYDLSKVKEIIFGNRFNQSISNLDMVSLKKIKFGEEFNQPIDNLPNGLIKLEFDSASNFNYPIENLPVSLRSLSLSGAFNKPIEYLPANLANLELGYKFNQPIDNLPIGLKKLSWNNNFSKFNKPINLLPQSLVTIIFNNSFNQPIDNLPSSIKTMVLPSNYSTKIKKLPESIKTIVLRGEHKEQNKGVYNTPELIESLVQGINNPEESDTESEDDKVGTIKYVDLGFIVNRANNDA